MLKLSLPIALYFLAPLPLLSQIPADLNLETVIERSSVPAGLEQGLVALKNAGDATNRLFLVEQDGQVWVWNGSQVLATPFLDIEADVAQGAYIGLFGLAFHPNYGTNGYFFVNYTYHPGAGSDRMRVERFTVSAGDPNQADLATRSVIIEFENHGGQHNGGDLAFGPDGYLYIAMGDSGGQEDPFNTGQDVSDLQGNILRIDPDGTPPGLPNDLCGLVQGYAIPATNPFAGGAGDCDEVWAYGLRNPWKISFDRLTGDFFIADVGQYQYEEVDIEPAGSLGGTNYGWDCREAGHDFTGASSPACPGVGMVDPNLEYDHSGGKCSITGGYRYRGAITGLQGYYIYADYCSNDIFLAEETSPGNWSGSVWTDSAAASISSFGEDEAGEIYVVQYFGDVLRFTSSQGTEIFADGFESGDLSAWSASLP